MFDTGANAVTTKDNGAITSHDPLSSCHRVAIDNESFPTGIDSPRESQISSATARTPSYKSASSPGSPAAAIQLADSFTVDSSSTPAAAMFVMASATAIRQLAAGSTKATGERSPIEIASP